MLQNKKNKVLNVQAFGYLLKKAKNKIPTFESYCIPIVSRVTLEHFMGDLKEYQTDMTKKISENLLKNQKMLINMNAKSEVEQPHSSHPQNAK